MRLARQLCKVMQYIFMLNWFVCVFESSFPIELELKYVQISFKKKRDRGLSKP